MDSSLAPRREFLKTILRVGACSWWTPVLTQHTLGQSIEPARKAAQSNRIPGTRFKIAGRVGDYLAGVTEQWLKVAPESNPAMLEMFRDRDRRPARDLVPWAGEFAGKYLVSAVQVWRVTGDPSLKNSIAQFVKQLLPLQAEDGYLGPWPKGSRLTGRAPNAGPKGGETWDAWGHYHIMLGLLLWHEDTRDAATLGCAR